MIVKSLLFVMKLAISFEISTYYFNFKSFLI